MELLLGLIVGVGLSAACGCRVFLPLLVACIGAKSGHLTLANGFEWIGSNAALAAFVIATIVELLGYLVPWVDNALDLAAVPAAAIAGSLLTASLVGDVSPFLRWSLAIIAGGTVAGGVSATFATARAGSSATTGGIANPVLALLESAGSVALSILAVLAPFIALGVCALFFVLLARIVLRRRAKSIDLSALS